MGGMQVGLRHFDSLTLDWFAGQLRAGGMSRHALSRELCERTNWRNPRGGLCISAASKALPVLAEHLGLDLPQPRITPQFSGGPTPPAAQVPDLQLACGIEGLGSVRLEQVGKGSDRLLWEAMMAEHHPLGWAKPPGGQMRYWLRSELHGTLGGLGFGSASFQLRSRDEWIGWTADQRGANITQLICNHRFLLLPGLRVPGLASQALSMATARVAQDWEDRYSVRPRAAYTHIGFGHDGYSYHCAGWTKVGETSGRRGEAKMVWALALDEDWRWHLCRDRRRPIGSLAGAYDGAGDADWAEKEYGRSSHTDGRMRRRIVATGRKWRDHLGEDLSVMFPTETELRSVRRLLSSPRVTMEHILEPHCEATVDRCRGEKVILAVQDRTALNYTGLEATAGLAEIGGGGKGGVGILAHAGLAVTAEGRPLGLFAMDASFRDDPDPDSCRWVRMLGRAGELAAACPGSRVITVCDREGDFWDLLAHAVDDGNGLLVRASRSMRQRVRTESGKECLWAHIAGLRPTGMMELTIPAAGGRRARMERQARLEIRTASIELLPPGWDSEAPPLPLYAVSATEADADAGDAPLHWLLLTTEFPPEGETDAVHAATVLDWYRKRWVIETVFKTLKTGTKIKSRRLDQADDLRKCLAFDAITACHVADVTILAREHPELPATEVFPAEDIDLLHTLLAAQGHRNVVRMKHGPPTIEAVVIDIGRLVGFHPSKPQRLPGTKKVWQGLERLNWAVQVRDALGEKQLE